ncbi:MAG: GNAT family protein [Burkholderiaceae bacterium]|nr:GNAT family protein [Burkholderiaceae bacterium]
MLKPRTRPPARYRPRTVFLTDGRRVTLRAILEADAAEIVQAFERLSADSRYLRFMQHKRAIDAAVLHRGVRPIPGEEGVFVATVPAADGIDIVGAARFVRSASNVGDARDICEFAITVAEAWRGSGLATELLRSLVRRARHDGYRIIEGFVLAENRPMLALARRLHFEIAPQPGDATTLRVWRSLRPERRLSARRTAR